MQKVTDRSGERHYSLDGEKVPSVTTILDKTKSQKAKDSLNAWRERVGYSEASRISRESTLRGDKMHKYLEDALHGEQSLDFEIFNDEEKKMSEVIINQGLNKKLDEIWGCETPLYYPNSHAGTTDLCGIYDNEESIIDFKSSTKTKKREWITDYFLQTCAYALAHNLQHDTNITQGVILMCTPNLEFQEFIIKDNEFLWYQKKFMERVDQYKQQVISNNE
ncbi:MAG: hypothetical protein VX093_03670 [Pseudomonadota bacterium]|nr:hypothetical protein [Pseudomonadota bacterium]